MTIKGKESEVEETTVTETEETPKAEVPTPTEPNPLEAQIQELKAQLNLKDESYKGLQRKLTQVTEDLKRRGLSEGRLDTLEQTQRLLVSALSERENINLDEIPQEKKTDYLKKFDEMISQQKLKTQQEELTARVRDYQTRTEALKLDPQSDEYLEIKDLVLDGKFDRAERRLTKLEGAKVEPKAEPKIDLETERAKIREEERKKLLIERGELNAETGQPSGASQNFKQLERAYSENPRDPVIQARYFEARRKRGL